MAYVNTQVSHNLNRLWIYPGCRLRASGPDIKFIIKRLQESVGHLAAATVACAKDQYFHFLKVSSHSTIKSGSSHFLTANSDSQR